MHRAHRLPWLRVQAPLQPLQDNLESQTYETFERDTNKYLAYEEAVHAALLDRVPEVEAATRTTVLMVVGAGRGPLVRASLRAAERTGRRLRIFAVEKNPNAVVTLQNLVVSEGCATDHCDRHSWLVHGRTTGNGSVASVHVWAWTPAGSAVSWRISNVSHSSCCARCHYCTFACLRPFQSGSRKKAVCACAAGRRW